MVKAFQELENALVAARVPKDKAEEVVEAFSEAMSNQLATKEDVKVLHAEIREIRAVTSARFQAVMWFVASVWGGIVILFIQNMQ